MMAAKQIPLHPDDGALVRFLDQQATPDERRWLFTHLAECGECTARMEALQDQSQALSRLVEALDEVQAPDELARARALSAARRAQAERPPARRWHLTGAARVAAVAALAALVTLGVEPVRAWVGDRWADLVGADEPAAVVAVQPTGVLERGSVISFVPAGQTFVLEIEHLQQGGSVTLELAQGASEATAQVVSGRDEEILVLPSGVRVANSSASTASYTFTLPSNLRLIQVFAGGRPIAILPLDDVSLPWLRTVSLDASATR